MGTVTYCNTVQVLADKSTANWQLPYPHMQEKTALKCTRNFSCAFVLAVSLFLELSMLLQAHNPFHSSSL